MRTILKAGVSEVMPVNTENCKIVNVEGTTSKFKASIRVGFKSEEDIITFIKELRYKKRIVCKCSSHLKNRFENRKVLVEECYQYFR